MKIEVLFVDFRHIFYLAAEEMVRSGRCGIKSSSSSSGLNLHKQKSKHEHSIIRPEMQKNKSNC